MTHGIKVLITGGSGLLGRYLSHTALSCNPLPNCEIATTSYCNEGPFCNLRIDITDYEAVQRAFYVFKPDVVIHTAAIGAVDYCEKNPPVAYSVNQIGSSIITDACKDFNAKLVFLSTNAVFDGTNPPYSEIDEPHPLSVYGTSKYRAEKYIRNTLPESQYLIVRTARLFGRNWIGGRKNWVDILKGVIENKGHMDITTDDVANPTYAGSLADSIWSLIFLGAYGIYHVAGAEAMTMYEFASRLLSNLYGVEPKDYISPVSSDNLPKGVMVRPANTSYDMYKLRRSGAHVPGRLDDDIYKLKLELNPAEGTSK